MWKQRCGQPCVVQVQVVAARMAIAAVAVAAAAVAAAAAAAAVPVAVALNTASAVLAGRRRSSFRPQPTSLERTDQKEESYDGKGMSLPRKRSARNASLDRWRLLLQSAVRGDLDRHQVQEYGGLNDWKNPTPHSAQSRQ